MQSNFRCKSLKTKKTGTCKVTHFFEVRKTITVTDFAVEWVSSRWSARRQFEYPERRASWCTCDLWRQARACTERATSARHDRYILLSANAVGHRRRVAHGIEFRLPELLAGSRIVGGEGAVQ